MDGTGLLYVINDLGSKLAQAEEIIGALRSENQRCMGLNQELVEANKGLNEELARLREQQGNNIAQPSQEDPVS